MLSLCTFGDWETRLPTSHNLTVRRLWHRRCMAALLYVDCICKDCMCNRPSCARHVCCWLKYNRAFSFYLTCTQHVFILFCILFGVYFLKNNNTAVPTPSHFRHHLLGIMDHVQYLAQVVHFLKNDESTQAGILKYEIVNVSDLILSLKTAGVRCSRQKLETILDDLSILRSRNSHGSNRGGRPAKESSAPAEALCQCVYILVESKAGSLKVASATYVGYTTNPEHRLRQHNGEIKGGAKKTAFGGRQWKIAAVVYGFPNKKCALQFELVDSPPLPLPNVCLELSIALCCRMC